MTLATLALTVLIQRGALKLVGDRERGVLIGATHPDPASYSKKFSGRYAHRLLKGRVGHNLPQEAPQAFAEAIVDVDRF
jgi:hypothetical protein